MTDVSLNVLPNRVRPSRNARRRAIVLIVVQLLMVAHIVHWLVAGRTVSPVEPSESMELVKRGVINAGAVFFIVAMLSTVVLGRWFCGWGCHMVMLQDFCGWMLKRVGIRPRPFRSRLLLWVPFGFAVYMFVWPAVARLGVIPLSHRLHGWFEWIPAMRVPSPWPGFHVELMTDDFWATFASPAVAVPFLLVCGFATVYFLGMKGLCSYGCPYGGFFAPLDDYAPGRIRVTDACEQCGHCTATCSSNVRVHEEVAAYGMVVDPGCLKCMDCVSVCPKNALYFGFGKPAALKGAARRAYRAQRWHLTWPEEIAAALVFLGSFTAYRGLYDLIPMLMAISMALVTTFAAWKAWRVVRDDNAAFHRWRLRFHRRWTVAGAVFVTLVATVLAATAHAGVVQATMSAARSADGRVTVGRNAIFGASPMQLPAEMRADAERAIALYRRAASLRDGGIGLVTTTEIETRLAWLHACLHDFAEAEARMRRRIDRFGITEVAAGDLAALMAVQLREDEAFAYAHGVVRDHPEFTGLLDQVVQQLWEEDRRDEALELCRTAIAALADDEARQLYVMRRLSLLLLDQGDLEEAIATIETTIEIDATNPSAHRVLGDAYEMAGRPDDAAAARARADELDRE